MPPIRNRNAFKKRIRKKGPYAKKKRITIASVNAKVTKIQKAVEYKHYDAVTSGAVSTSGSLINLTSITLGDSDAGQRDGDKLTMSSIIMRGEVSAGDVPYNHLRVVFFNYDRAGSGGAAPALDDLFLTASFPNQPHLWLYNKDQFAMRKGLRIISDRIYKTRSYDGTNIQSVSFYRKIKKRMNLQFYAGTTTSAQSVWLMVVSDSNAIPHPTLSLTTRINYCDM